MYYSPVHCIFVLSPISNSTFVSLPRSRAWVSAFHLASSSILRIRQCLTADGTMSTSGDELDSILDSALDAFNLDDKPPAPAPAAAGNTVTSNKQAIGSDNSGSASAGAATASNSSNNAPDAGAGAGANARRIPSKLDEEAALRAFREALTAPLDGADAEDEEADLALVEEFVRGLDALNDGVNANSNGECQTPAAAESFVKQLLEDMLSKEVLREPVAQIRDALAKCLADDVLPEDDRERHREQHAIADELCKEFDAEARPERVVELLAKLRDSGQLPDNVAANLPDPDNEAEQLSGLADTADACPVQ